jgi:hypothetical protein
VALPNGEHIWTALAIPLIATEEYPDMENITPIVLSAVFHPPLQEAIYVDSVGSFASKLELHELGGAVSGDRSVDLPAADDWAALIRRNV